MAQVRNYGGGPEGLGPCPFQHKNESVLFRMSSLYQKGHFPWIEKTWSEKFSGGFATSLRFFFVAVKRQFFSGLNHDGFYSRHWVQGTI